MVEEGSFVRIAYTGRIKETGELFDTTDEELAKEEDAFNPNMHYGPITVVVGGGYVIEGMDETLEDMSVGEEREIEVPPEKAFGERNSDNIKLIPLKEFEDQGMSPQPGMMITMNRMQGKVLSVNSGRVRVDFNHPLAGKALDYEVEVLEQVGDKEEQVESIADFFIQTDFDVEIDGSVVEISLEDEVPDEIQEKVEEEIEEYVEIEEVQFTEEGSDGGDEGDED